MFRITKLSHKFYARKILDVTNDQENIEVFISEGTPVIIVENIEDVEQLDIDPSEIEVVK